MFTCAPAATSGATVTVGSTAGCATAGGASVPPGIGTAPTSPPNEPPGPTTGVGAAAPPGIPGAPRLSVLSRAAAGGGGAGAATAGGVMMAAGAVVLALLGRGWREALPGRGCRAAAAEVERAGRAASEEEGRLGSGWRDEAGPEAEGRGWSEEAGPAEPGRGARGSGGLSVGFGGYSRGRGLTGRVLDRGWCGGRGRGSYRSSHDLGGRPELCWDGDDLHADAAGGHVGDAWHGSTRRGDCGGGAWWSVGGSEGLPRGTRRADGDGDGSSTAGWKSVLSFWWWMDSWYVRVGGDGDGDGVVRHHTSIRRADCHGLEDGDGRRRLVLPLFNVLRRPHPEGLVQHSMSSAYSRLSSCQHFCLAQQRQEMDTHLSERQLAQKEHYGPSLGSHFL